MAETFTSSWTGLFSSPIAAEPSSDLPQISKLIEFHTCAMESACTSSIDACPVIFIRCSVPASSKASTVMWPQNGMPALICIGAHTQYFYRQLKEKVVCMCCVKGKIIMDTSSDMSSSRKHPQTCVSGYTTYRNDRQCAHRLLLILQELYTFMCVEQKAIYIPRAS